MAEVVSVYVGVHGNGTLSINVEVPLDMLQKDQSLKLDVDSDKELERLVKNWMGMNSQPETKKI